MKKMQAVIYYAPGDIRVEMIPVPACGKDEIRVKIDACAVCGTDLKAFKSGNPRIKAPQVMGHEFTGLVETSGENVKDFSTGERVVMATSVSCGKCLYCKKGWNNLCADVAPMGFSYPGGMAEYVVIPEKAIRNGHVIRVPDDVKPKHAALSEPMSCAVNSLQNCNIQQGDTVLIIGAGPMGIMNACVAKELGAGRIILAELNEHRLKQADGFGVDILVNPQKQDLTEAVMAETNGLGADVVIVAAPAAQPQEQALDLVRKRGTVCLFASLPAGKSQLSLDSRKIHYGELRIVGSSDSTPAQVAKAVELLNNAPDMAEKLVTHQLALNDVLHSFELMQSGEALRVILKI